MTDEEYYKEINFIREKIYEIASLICKDKIQEASFLCGSLYAECRVVCEKLNPNKNEDKNAPM